MDPPPPERLQRLESISRQVDCPSDEDYGTAQVRSSYHSWLWNATIVRTFGGEIPGHCQPIVEAAKAALAEDTPTQAQIDQEVTQAWCDTRRISDATDYKEILIQKLRQIALRMKPGSKPDTMAGALAQVLFRAEWMQAVE